MNDRNDSQFAITSSQQDFVSVLKFFPMLPFHQLLPLVFLYGNGSWTTKPSETLFTPEWCFSGKVVLKITEVFFYT